MKAIWEWHPTLCPSHVPKLRWNSVDRFVYTLRNRIGVDIRSRI